MPRLRRRSGSQRLPTISSREEGWKITGSVWCLKLVEQGRKLGLGPYIPTERRGKEMYEDESAVGWRKADCASPRETSARRVGTISSSSGYELLLAERGGPSYVGAH